MPTTDLRPSLLSTGLLGVAQILTWGGSFFIMAVLATPIVEDTGWPRTWVYGSLSLSILLSGLIAPAMGRLVARRGGRSLLASSGIFIAAGLMGMALAANVVVFVCAWLVIGLGMGVGLYDALFATLGKVYGAQSKLAISRITLISGFATTISWPVVAGLVHSVGWRHACMLYALVLIIAVVPLYLVALPKDVAANPDSSAPAIASGGFDSGEERTYKLISAAFSLAAIVMTAVSVQLISLLQAKGVSMAAAIAVAALIGPAQVGARMLDSIFGKELHPIWPTVASAGLVVAGLTCVVISPALATLGILVYGTGSGMRAIVRGTLPMAVFDKRLYPVVIGRLARPALIAQALTPLVGGWIQGSLGADLTLGLLLVVGVLNLIVVAVLFQRVRVVAAVD